MAKQVCGSRMPPARLQVSVVRQAYDRWDAAVVIRNELVEVVVVPEIGRVVAYQFQGRPDSNPIWMNPEADPDPIRGWVNLGGDKLWPSPQDDWGLRGTPESDWPPCSAIDTGPYVCREVPGGVLLEGPVSGYFAVATLREITLTPGSTTVNFVDAFVKSSQAPSDKDGFPIALWNITQIRPDAVAYIPMNPQSRFGLQGHVTLFGKAKHEPNCKRHGDLLEIRHNSEHSTKFGADAAAGWIGAVYGDVLFTEYSEYDPSGRYLDCGTSAQVWTNDNPPYMELEVQGPGRDLRAGESMSRTVTWNLQGLPRRPVDAVDARSMVSTAMSEIERTAMGEDP